MKCGVYARFSSNNQNPASIHDQIFACQRYAEGHSLEISDDHIYVDEALSGIGVQHRAGYQQLLVALSLIPPPFQILLVDDLSRLSRDAAEILRLVRLLQGNGLTLISVADGIETGTKLSKLAISVKALFNELYLDDLRDRTMRGMQGRFSRGHHTGGKIFGYRSFSVLDSSGRVDSTGQPLCLGKKLEIHPEEAQMVQSIFQWFAEGLGLRSIARRLNGPGHTGSTSPPTLRSNGNWWSSSGVRIILKNEKYRGQWVWGRRAFIKDHVTGKRRARIRPASEWQVEEFPHLRIVSDDLWDQVYHRFRRLAEVYPNRTPHGRLSGKAMGAPSPRTTLFSGILRCGICGGGLVVVSGGTKNPGGRYGCGFHRDKGNEACRNNLTVKITTVESTLVGMIKEKVFHPEALRYLAKAVNHHLERFQNVKDQHRQQIERELESVDKEIKNIGKAILAGVVGETTAALLHERETRRKALLQQLVDIQTSHNSPLLHLDEKAITAQLNQLAEVLNQDPGRVNTFFRQHLTPITCVPVEKEKRRFYRASGASNGEEFLKTLGLAQSFTFGGCGGGI